MKEMETNVVEPNASLQEKIENEMNRRVEVLAQWEGEAEWWEKEKGFIPTDIEEGLQEAYLSLDSYSSYWGFDC
jgi:hypothetical protein